MPWKLDIIVGGSTKARQMSHKCGVTHWMGEPNVGQLNWVEVSSVGSERIHPRLNKGDRFIEQNARKQ